MAKENVELMMTNVMNCGAAVYIWFSFLTLDYF